ncbi:hypothetical protein R1flu_012853 [Riccia fluitans]|uniref:C2 domain-containing protein n=1 Tax=Riccia fluitans TaxID=41844 RepID=A0ABD1ZBY2_9MARC
MCLAAHNLPRLDLTGGADPYIIISQSPDGSAASSEVLYISEVRSTLSPWWTRISLPFYKIKEEQQLRLTSMDRDNYTDDDIAGVAVVPVSEVFKLAAIDEDHYIKTVTKGLSTNPAQQIVLDNTDTKLVFQSVVIRKGPAA